MTTAYSYTRFSSAVQTLGDSQRRQSEAFDTYCHRNKLTPADLKLHDKGVSGFRGKNKTEGKLGLFLSLVEQKKISVGSVLVVESLDRLGREEPMEAQDTFRKIIKSGIKIVTLSDGQEYTTDSLERNPSQHFIILAVQLRANEESKIKSYRVKARWENAHKLAIKGVPHNGTTPSWIDQVDGKYIFNSKADTIRLIVKLAMEGKGMMGVVKELNRLKLAPLGWAKAWSVSSIQHLLYSRSMIGEYLPATGRSKQHPLAPIPNYYPALITSDEFYKLQNVMNCRKKSAKGRGANTCTNLFGRLLVNGVNGSHYVISKKKSRLYLATADTMYKGERDTLFPYLPFEKGFLKWVSEVKLETRSEVSKAAVVAGQLAEVEGRIAKLQTAMIEGDVDSIIPVIRQLDAKRKTIAAQLESERAKETTAAVQPGDVGNLASKLDRVKGEDLIALRVSIRSAIAQLIQSIKLFVVKVEGEINKVALAMVEFQSGEVRFFCVRTFRKGPTPQQDYSIGFAHTLRRNPALKDSELTPWLSAMASALAHAVPTSEGETPQAAMKRVFKELAQTAN